MWVYEINKQLYSVFYYITNVPAFGTGIVHNYDVETNNYNFISYCGRNVFHKRRLGYLK